MKRLLLLCVCVACCSFILCKWIWGNKPQSSFDTQIILTPEQELWLQQRFAQEEVINKLQRKVNILQEAYDRVLTERTNRKYWSAADARKYVQTIEQSEDFKNSANCATPTDQQIVTCAAYVEAISDREWWTRLTFISVRLNAAQYDLIQAQIKAGEFKDKTEETQRKLMKFIGTA